MPEHSFALSSLARESKSNNMGNSAAPSLDLMNFVQSKDFSNNLSNRRANETTYEKINGSHQASFSPKNDTNGRMGTF